MLSLDLRKLFSEDKKLKWVDVRVSKQYYIASITQYDYHQTVFRGVSSRYEYFDFYEVMRIENMVAYGDFESPLSLASLS